MSAAWHCSKLIQPSLLPPWPTTHTHAHTRAGSFPVFFFFFTLGLFIFASAVVCLCVFVCLYTGGDFIWGLVSHCLTEITFMLLLCTWELTVCSEKHTPRDLAFNSNAALNPGCAVSLIPHDGAVAARGPAVLYSFTVSKERKNNMNTFVAQPRPGPFIEISQWSYALVSTFGC